MKRIQHAKRAVALVLSAALLVGASACAKTDTQNQSAAPAAVSKSTDPLAKYSQTVVINTGRQTATNPRFPKGDTYENNAYTRFLKQKLNITIKDAFEANGADYDRQVSLAMAGNSLPDMMLVDNHSDLKEMVDNDQIMDLTDVYNQYASDKIKEYYNSYKDVYQGALSENARLTERSWRCRMWAETRAPTSRGFARTGLISLASRLTRTATGALLRMN